MTPEEAYRAAHLVAWHSYDEEMAKADDNYADHCELARKAYNHAIAEAIRARDQALTSQDA